MKYVLPRPYISWSQFDMFRKSPERYVAEYIENGRRLDTKYTRFGKNLHELIEKDEHKHLFPNLVVFKEREKEIKVTIHDIPILSRIDSYDPDTGSFRDTKTGKTAWTQVKVQKLDQLVFYAMVIKHSTGVTPKECFIDWIGTKDSTYMEQGGLHNTQPKVQLTGEVKTFKREISELEIERLEKELVEVVEKISNTYKTWLTQNI